MAENLLKICQNVADACQLGRPVSIIANNDDTSKLLLSRAKHEIEALSRRPDSHWSILERTHEFSIAFSGTTAGISGDNVLTVENLEDNYASVGDTIENAAGDQATVTAFTGAGLIILDTQIFTGGGEAYTIYRQAHALPSDYKHMIDNTHWNKDTYWSLRGPMTAMEWRHYKHSVLGNSVTLRNRWRIMAYPGPNALKHETNALYLDPEPTEDQDFVYEYVSNGLVFDDSGLSQETWQADTDTPVLEQYLIELGMIWRTLSRLGLPYAEELDEYEVQVEAAIGRDGGGRILDLARTTKPSFLSSDNVPDTGIGQ